MVSSIGTAGVAGWLSGARDALGRLTGTKPKSDAEQTLDRVLVDLKAAPRKQAIALARYKLDALKIRIDGLKLAAGSAAALGDVRASYALARDVRDVARDLRGALAAVTRHATDVSDADTRSGLDVAAAGVTTDAAGLIEGLGGVLRKGRPSLLSLFSGRRDRWRAADMFRQAESALDGARAAAAGSPVTIARA